MLPKNRLGRSILKKLHIYADSNHPHQSQDPKELSFKIKKVEEMANSFYGTGRRKTSVARVTLTEGTGKFTFNGKDVEQYFPSPSMKMTIEKPFKVVNMDS